MRKQKTRRKPLKPASQKAPAKQGKAKALAAHNGAPAADKRQQQSKAAALFPQRADLKSLYQRYSSGSRFDDHDKAFYFVLDVGGLSRAKQLLAHVEEVLAELEEFQG